MARGARANSAPASRSIRCGSNPRRAFSVVILSAAKDHGIAHPTYAPAWIFRSAQPDPRAVPMSVAQNQRQVFLRLLAALRPHWRRDPALPARIQSLLTGNRAFGARDRRLYRELIYTTLRHLPWIEPLLESQPDEAVRRAAWLAAETPATKPFRTACATGEPPSGDKTELLPAWFRPHCPEIFSGA